MSIITTNRQHYQDIANAIRSKNGSSTLYAPSEMAQAIVDLESGSSESTILVTAETGATVTCTCGATVKTAAEENGVWRFTGCTVGSWEVEGTLTKDGTTFRDALTVEIQEEGRLFVYRAELVFGYVYGVRRNVDSTSPQWIRTDMAEGVTEPTSSIGGVTGTGFTQVGQSVFDTFYPWSGIERVTFNGSNGLPGTGDVMMKIPKFYYRRYRQTDGDGVTWEHIQIGSNQSNGFKLHPAFLRNGQEKDHIYVAAYTSSPSGSIPKSVAGPSPDNYVSLPTDRNNVRNKGAGWEILDIASWSALQMLYLVEFATFDSQSAVGTGSIAYANDASPYNYAGVSDTVPNLTGMPEYASGYEQKVVVVYRGIESMWASIYKLVDGMICDGASGTYYLCTRPDKYGETLTDYYTPLSYQMPGNAGSDAYVTKLGLDEDFDYIMLPEEAEGGSESTYVCDGFQKRSSGLAKLLVGGFWGSGRYAGAFAASAHEGIVATAKQSSYRMIYIPQN